jgi:hypothetical protein
MSIPDRKPDWILIGSIASIAMIVSAAAIVLRPDLLLTSAFLTHDQGNQLLVGASLQQGKLLYRDINYPYGPIPAYALAAVANLAGMSARSYLWSIAMVSAIALAVTAHALRQHVGRGLAFGIVLVALMPLMLTPGGVVGAYTDNSYVGLERVILASLVLLWQPACERSPRRASVIGLVFGAWQFVKFGGAAFGLAALAVVDAFSLWMFRDDRARLGRAAGAWALCVAAFAVLESLRWFLLFALEPSGVAWAAAWPAYTAQLYGAIPESAKGPQLGNALELLTQSAIPLTALALTLVAIGRLAMTRASADRDALALLLPTAFFALGFLGYFGHSHTIRQYAWCLVPGTILALRRSALARGTLFLIALPALALMLKVIVVNRPDPSLQPMTMANGDVLWLTESRRVSAATMVDELRDSGRPERTLAMPAAGGLYFYSGTPLPSRHVWLLPHYIRPFEASAVPTWTDPVTTLYVLDGDTTDTASVREYVAAVFDRTLAAGVAPRIRQVDAVAPEWWRLRLSPGDQRHPAAVNTDTGTSRP